MACSDTPNSFKRLDTEETPESDVKKEIVVQQKEAGAASTEPRTKDEAWCHDEFPPLQDAVHITYCPRTFASRLRAFHNANGKLGCGFPPDFCDFGRCWTECQSYALEHYPQYYTHSLKQRGVSAEPARATQKPPQDSTSSSTLPSTASALPAVTKSKKKVLARVCVCVCVCSKALYQSSFLGVCSSGSHDSACVSGETQNGDCCIRR